MDFTGVRPIPDSEGRVRNIEIGNRIISIDSAEGKSFIEWNDRQPADRKIDLSNRAPAPVPVDPESSMQQRLIDYLKTDPQAVTAPQREAALRAIIRLVLRRENRLQDVDK